jgi:catechol 2,3-dioxygenase-like lactoylglutathione lyase family enzyme
MADHATLRFHHGGVSVPDIEAAIRWYGDILGFTVDRRFAIPGAKAAYIERDGLRIELFEPEGAAPLPEARRHPRSDLMTHGNKHVAFAIGDYDAFRAALMAKQVEIVLDVGESFGRAFFIRDNSGNVIEFVEA